MFYRVDYVFAVMGAGFLIGLFTGKWTLRFKASGLARAYYGAVLALLALSSIRLTFFLMLGHGPAWAGAISDLSGVLYGALFGIAARRDDRRDVLLWIGRYCLRLRYRLRLRLPARDWAKRLRWRRCTSSSRSPATRMRSCASSSLPKCWARWPC